MTAKQRPDVTTVAAAAKRLKIGRNQAYEAARPRRYPGYPNREEVVGFDGCA